MGLEHIGGYFEVDTVEKGGGPASGCGSDNSQLIQLAVEELHAKHMAKRAFGND